MDFVTAKNVLRKTSSTLRKISGMIELLGWDQEVYMPKDGIKSRSKQVAYLAQCSHKVLVNRDVEDAIKQVSTKQNKLGKVDKAIYRVIKHEYDRESKIPIEIVAELAGLTSQAQNAWEDAKKRSDFKIFEPFLKKIVDIKKEICELVGYEESPYDVLLDEYEPYMTEKKVEDLFRPLRKDIVSLVNKISASKGCETSVSKFKVPIKVQRKIGIDLIKRFEFDLDKGRLDEAEHPFTVGISPDDVRITTHYFSEDFIKAISSTVHECGHGLYEQGINTDLIGTGLDEGISLGIHESQSRFWENIVCRSESFWKFYLSKLKKKYPNEFSEISIAEIVYALNEVRPSSIRIYADEVTYNLHIILRFDIEKDLIKGDVSVNDLPELWMSKMREHLNVEPRNDREGVLQDVHWAHGAIGYFPTYLIGNLYCAQFTDTLSRELGNLENEIAVGSFSKIRGWLRDNIHRYGQLYTAECLCERVTRNDLDSKHFMTYLKNKYSNLYEF
jgi:carboxypeptidase Taq